MSAAPATTLPTPAALPALAPDTGFDAAARLVLEHLQAHVPMALWAVTRVENDRQTFLHADGDDVYDVSRGDGHPWEDSFCIRRAAGEAPVVAPDAQSVPAYAAAGVNRDRRIGSYGGAVVQEPDGALFGAICGISPDARALDGALASAGPLLTLLGRLLTMVLCGERVRDEAAAAALEATLSAETDALTGLYNRRAWERVCRDEEQRFERYADPTVAVVVDLDLLKEVNDTQGHASGDRYIQRAAAALRDSVRSCDVAARLGGDEFALLLRGCPTARADQAVARMYDALAAAGVAGSIGWAPITVVSGFPAALAEADAAMYAAKAARRRGRATAV
jgi:diguanylate cyclase (GGDEF)-like protein